MIEHQEYLSAESFNDWLNAAWTKKIKDELFRLKEQSTKAACVSCQIGKEEETKWHITRVAVYSEIIEILSVKAKIK